MLVLAGVAWVLRCTPAWMRPVRLNMMQHRGGAGELCYCSVQMIACARGCASNHSRCRLGSCTCSVRQIEYCSQGAVLPRLHEGDAGDVQGLLLP
jgi:hypothetical protein